MESFKIYTFPDEILLKPAEPVAEIDGNLQKTIDIMAKTMYQAPGVGLAATQVGLNRQLLIYDIQPRDETPLLSTLINPRIISHEGEIISPEEGCLSVPDFRSDVKRFERILVEAVDRDGKPVRIEAEGFHAIVLQHEIDHLNGILFIDRISALKRSLYKKRVLKRLKQKKP
ncbi:MAG: peptide deformylase [Desulfatirhabdiaceae bacterium]|jgi:peptide deformylase